MNEYKYKIGTKVDKVSGYSFPGTVVGAFKNLNGDVRYVVEMDNHRLLHIFNEAQLKSCGKLIVKSVGGENIIKINKKI